MTSHFQCDIQLLGSRKNSSTGLWTTTPPQIGKAVLFIHGFNGEAVSTWTEFERFLLLEPKCQDRDIIFFGYDGLKTYAEVSAQEFGKFLDRLCTDPHSIFSPSFPKSVTRDKGFTYGDVLIVAHSLGAVVSRRALLNAFGKKNWVSKIRLVLFAPAHNGTRTVGWVSSVITGFIPGLGSSLSAFFERNCRAAADLKEGSRVLDNLRDDMNTALGKPYSDPLCAKAVVWSKDDDVVVNGVFPGDVQPDDPPSEKNHQKVCKPNGKHEDPLKVLRRLL